MRSIADAEGYAALPVPDGVGGRFSVLSAVGLFSASMCGIDIEALLAGARAMAGRVEAADWQANPAAVLAAVHKLAFDRGLLTCVMMPYADGLVGLADWFCQLWAESLGKEKDMAGRTVRAGQTPVRALGATDQHSQLQLYREGPVRQAVRPARGERVRRETAHTRRLPRRADAGDAGRQGAGPTAGGGETGDGICAVRERAGEPVDCLAPDRRRARRQFIFLYEAAVSIAGLLLGINAYDQPRWSWASRPPTDCSAEGTSRMLR